LCVTDRDESAPVTRALHDLIAVLDVGKTNAKLSLVDAATGSQAHIVQRANAPTDSLSMRQLDVAGIEHWFLEQLRDCPERKRITALVPVAHGAACVLVDERGQVLATPDYEDTCFRKTASEYDRERDPFTETLSPRLPDGLNLGAQLYFLETRHPQVFARAARIFPLPQYWAWRFSGVAASEVSSLGAHSDLWCPVHNEFSPLARRRGWDKLFPPLRPATAMLGLIDERIAALTGLSADCQVFCGVHDSNASWLAHLCEVRRGAALTVISSGTWIIAMTSSGDLARLREDRDMLANVDVFSSPVATARFMGGREYAAIAGPENATPSIADLQRVMAAGSMALPAFAEAGGPFPGRVGRIVGVGSSELAPGERAALASAYVALVTDVLLDLLGESDTIVIDGPFAGNPLYAGILKTLRPGASISISNLASGAAAGALALVLGKSTPTAPAADRPVAALPVEGLIKYRDEWRSRVDC
jgi:sugar (pentulose or hexulose) kinase